MIELVSRIKSVDNYSPDYKVYFAGNISDENLKDYYSYYDNEVFPLAMPYNSLLFPCEYKETINRYGAYIYEEPDADDIKDIIQSDEFKTMSSYPNYNSIKVINNVVVVKFDN